MGILVLSISSESPGISGTEVIAIAANKIGFIITEDKDFADELVYRKTHAIGSMLLRMPDVPIRTRCQLLVDTLMKHAGELKNCFSVLTTKKLRIRKYI